MKTLSLLFILAIGSAYAVDEATLRANIKTAAYAAAGVTAAQVSVFLASDGDGTCDGGYAINGDSTTPALYTTCVSMEQEVSTATISGSTTTTTAATSTITSAKTYTTATAAPAEMAF